MAAVGVGARFLRWFADHVNGRLPAGDRVRVLENSFEQANVDVWRERERADITIRFKREKCLIAVENKLESASSDHLGQVMGYDRTTSSASRSDSRRREAHREAALTER